MTWFRNFVQLSSLKSSLRPRTATTPFPNTQFVSILQFSSQPNSEPTRHVQRSGLGPTSSKEKPRVVVLGSGWAGCRVMKGLDTNIYDVVCVSPRNHMVFTPLLASTCVGTLEFRSVAEPIARIQPVISRETGSYFFLANCNRVDPENHVVCRLNFCLLGF